VPRDSIHHHTETLFLGQTFTIELEDDDDKKKHVINQSIYLDVTNYSMLLE